MQRRLRVLGLGALVAIALLVVGLLLQANDVDARHDAVRAQLAKETRKVFGKPLYKAADIRKTIDADEGSETALDKKSSAYDLMYRTVEAIDDKTQLTLTRFEVDVGRNIIQLRGDTGSPQDVDGIVSNLEKVECFKNIKREKIQVRSDERVSFRLDIQSECS